MPTISTCGPAHVRTEFSYRGNTSDGVTFEFNAGDFAVDPEVIRQLLEHFRGQVVRGGFSMTDPTPGGVGEFLQNIGQGLTPRHGSFLCAVLQQEGRVTCTLDGNAVVVTFNA
jgi:hypothetical protein